MTEEAYLKGERDAEVKHEYSDGRAYTMAGARNNHARISGNVFGEFGNHLKDKPCEAFGADTQVKLGAIISIPMSLSILARHPVLIILQRTR